jgi:hypothetical protein
MSEANQGLMRMPENLSGRAKRSQNLSTKLTGAEARSIEEAALRAGKSPSEWALRGTATRCLRHESGIAPDRDLHGTGGPSSWS